ncbi:hypothetical protein 16Q_153 [Pseudomonas phage 16Q]|nr:hypothetical protein 16Q_153 [Pseudomonas phage 16Q]
MKAHRQRRMSSRNKLSVDQLAFIVPMLTVLASIALGSTLSYMF